MPRQASFFLLTLLLLAAGIKAVFAQTDDVPSAAHSPIALLQATTLGKTQFPPGDTASGGNGQTVDGIKGSGHEMLKSHTHAHLALFYHGEQLAIPYGIGIIQPFSVVNNFVGAGKGYYCLHTHDASGIVHIESPDQRAYTLGDFFDIWGEPLSAHNVAGLRGKVRAYVNGRIFSGKFRDIPLSAHNQITLEVGEPFVRPPLYRFPDGL